MTSIASRFRAALCVLLFPIVAAAMTSDVRLLIDADRDPATGCTIARMSGVDHVLVTRVMTTAASAVVTRSYRQVCMSGAGLGPEISVDNADWPAGASRRDVLVETRFPAAALGATIPPAMRVGVQVTAGTFTESLGESLLLPLLSSRRRAVDAPGSERVMSLDGSDDDWQGLAPVYDAAGTRAISSLRIEKVFAHAGRRNDEWLWFRVDLTLPDATPIADADAYTRRAGEAIHVDAPGVLANDDDPNGLPLTAAPASAPARGTLALNPDGSFTYTPDDFDSTVTDVFAYTASNGTEQSSATEVRIDVAAPSNGAPSAAADAFSGTEDTELRVTVPGVLANDVDNDGDPITASLVTAPANGTITLNADGSFTYMPRSEFSGTDAFEYEASDGALTARATVTLSIAAVNDAPAADTATYSIFENAIVGAAVGVVNASDVDTGDTLTFSIIAGNDRGAFAIDAATGQITIADASAIDFETTPQFVLTVRVADDGVPAGSASTTITIDVIDIDEPPFFTSSALFAHPENTTSIASVAASDPEGLGLTYSIGGGADAARFVIEATTGALRFTAPPDFETPADADGNNVYDVVVTATDGTTPVAQSMAVTVTDANEAPLFEPSTSIALPESTTAVLTLTASDPESDVVTFAIGGGDDAARFTLSGSELSFTSAPDFETPLDADANNSYLVAVTATDGTNNVERVLTINVTNLDEAPLFTSPSVHNVPENALAVTTVSAADPEGTALAYSLTGGVDAAQFTIDANTGALQFLTPPDFEAPADADGNDIYEVIVTATDGTTPVAQSMTITVTNANEAPVITTAGTTYDVVENSTAITTITATDPDGTSPTFSIAGGADAAAFAIDAAGALTFVTPPDYELPSDAGANRVYEVIVRASDAEFTSDLAITVTILGVNEAPLLTVAGGLTHTESGGAVNVLASASIVDVDDTQLESATIAITANLRNGADSLSFTNTPSITGVYDAVNGRLTLTGTATVAEYESALRAIQFDNTADHQPVPTRTITFTVNDGELDSAPQDVILNMAGVNQAPTVRALTSSTSTPEDTPATWSYADIWFYDPELEGIFPYPDAKLTIVATHGTVTLGSVDGLDFSTAGAIGDGVDDAQIVVFGSIIELRIAVAGLVFTPETNYVGPAGFTITIDDLGIAPAPALQDSVTVDVAVTPVNDPPSFAGAGDVTIDEDSAAYSAAWASAISPGPANESSQAVRFTTTVLSVTGGLTFVQVPIVADDGALAFEASPDSCGVATVVVRAFDDGGTPLDPADDAASIAQTFTISVACVNDAPFAQDDVLTAIDEDSAPRFIATSALLANDGSGANESSQVLTIGVVGNAVGGSVALAGTDVVFTPFPDFAGTASFTYTAWDDGVPPLSATATVTFPINALSEPPIVSVGSGTEDTQLSGLVISPHPLDGAGVTHYRITSIEGGQLYKSDGLTVIVDGDLITMAEGAAGLRFMPLPDRNTPAGDAFTFTVQGALDAAGSGLSGGRVVSITVAEVNDAPFATDDFLPLSVPADSAAVIITGADLVANDSKGPMNEAGQTLTIIAADNAVGGTVAISGGNVIFTPWFGFSGAASSRYHVTDDGTTTAAPDPKTSTATAVFTIAPPMP